MVKRRCFKWIWIPLIILSILTIIESKRRHKRSFSVSNNYQQQQYIISKENHEDLTFNSTNKKSLNIINGRNMATATTSLFDMKQIVKKKTLIDLEKPMLSDDINKRFDLNELSNDTHIRVKRTDSEFDNRHNSLIHLKNNYLEDLANSFPGKSLNNFNKYYNNSNYQNVSSNSNETFVNIHDDDEDKVGYFVEVNNTRFKRENKSKKNGRRRVGHGKRRKMKKHSGEKGKKKGISFKGTNKRHPNSLKIMSPSKSKRINHMIENNSSKIVDKIESKIEKKDSTKDNISCKKDDNEQQLAEQEETLINENEDANLKIVNDTVRDKRSLHKKYDIVFRKRGISKNGKFRLKRNEMKDYIIPNYPNIIETSSSLSMLSENNQNEKPRADRAVKSIEEIKELAEKLVTKVNELQNYLSYENEEIIKKNKKLESREIEVPRDNNNNNNNNNNTIIEEEFVLETPKFIDECVRIGDLSSALKSLDDKNSSLDKTTLKEQSETERITLLNDRMIPLAKRIVGKNRIKRKSRRKWGRWTGWSSCSVTCGKGRQIRWRHCLRDCSTVETEMEEKACQMTACPPGKFLGIF